MPRPPHRNPVGALHSPPLPSSFTPPNPHQPTPLGIWQNKGTVFIPAPTPAQLAARRRHAAFAQTWQRGTGSLEMEMIFPWAVGKMGRGAACPPTPAPQVRGEGRAASPDKRQRENRASPAHGVGASSSGWGCVESHLSLHQLAWVPIPELQPSVPANQ